MRSVSGAFNRIILATFGLALVAAASWFVASGLGAGRYWPDADRYLAPAQDSFSSIVAPLTHSNWLIPICALLSLFDRRGSIRAHQADSSQGCRFSPENHGFRGLTCGLPGSRCPLPGAV